MRLWRRRAHAPGSQAPRSKARRARRAALFTIPLLAITVLALAASGVMGTLAQGTATILNNNNQVRTLGAGLTETQDSRSCPAAGNGQWTGCDNINKFRGGSLSSGESTGPQTVTLTNTGDTEGRLFLLPSACSDSLTGALGALCSLATVTVSCTPGNSLGPLNLNAFFAGRNITPTPPGVLPPSGYLMATIPPGGSTDCTFEVMVGTIPPPGGTISQPLAWKLVA